MFGFHLVLWLNNCIQFLINPFAFDIYYYENSLVINQTAVFKRILLSDHQDALVIGLNGDLEVDHTFKQIDNPI